MMDRIEITPELLADLQEKAKKATPGKWQVLPDSHDLVVAPDNCEDICIPADKNKRTNATYIAAASPQVVLALVEYIRKLERDLDGLCHDDTEKELLIERLEREADWLSERALCHSEIGTLSCPHTFRNITCKPFEEWRKEKDAKGECHGLILIDRATCMELGKSCWREAARKAVAEQKA